MCIIEKVKDRLSIIENLYDVIRVIDPINKKVLEAQGNEDEIPMEACYCFWNKDKPCEHCISIRANLGNDTFLKLEYKGNKIFLATATPIIINNRVYIVEILKDITNKGQVSDESISRLMGIRNLISKMNEKVIKEEGIKIIKEKSKQLTLKKLSEGIEELRHILNEICCTVDESENDKERLIISKCLDELIVEYMRELNR